jgi:hypothetical protein
MSITICTCQQDQRLPGATLIQNLQLYIYIHLDELYAVVAFIGLPCSILVCMLVFEEVYLSIIILSTLKVPDALYSRDVTRRIICSSNEIREALRKKGDRSSHDDYS